MFLIKLMFTLIYYGSLIYTIYKSGQMQQEYSGIMDAYKQARERAFPNLTEKEHKKRKKVISQYYEAKNPSFALKRKFSFIIAIIALVFLYVLLATFFLLKIFSRIGITCYLIWE